MDSASEKIVTPKKPEHVLLVSSQFPSGVAWLLNIFVELGILVYRGSLPERVWLREPNGSYFLTPREVTLKQWIPSLCDHERFTFEDGIDVEWTHDFPPLVRSYKPDFIIHFIRDGRDALYSHHKRNNIPFAFEDWLSEPLPSITLPAPEAWALHTVIWQATYLDIPHHLIRFEDAKADPEQTIKALLEKIGVQRTSEEIHLAINNSSQERARQVEDHLRDATLNKQPSVINRKGMSFEWKTTYTPSLFSAFQGFPKNVLEENGYDTSPIQESILPKEVPELPFAELTSETWIARHTAMFVKQSSKEIVNLEILRGLTRLIFNDPISYLSSINSLIDAGKRTEAINMIDRSTSFFIPSQHQYTLLAYQSLRLGSVLRARHLLRSGGHKRWLSYLWRQRPSLVTYIHTIKRICRDSIKAALLKFGLSETQTNNAHRRIDDLRGHLNGISRLVRYSLLPPKPLQREDGKRYLHLGCGNQDAPGWINVDIIADKHVHYRQDIRRLTRFKDNSVDYIYASHVLEHFPYRETPAILKEWNRILKPGGIIRVAVPNFDSLISIYTKTKNIDDILPPLMGGQNYKYNFHYSAFDQNSLFNLLESAGFSNMKPFDPRTEPTSVFQDFSSCPSIVEKTAYHISLNIEAIKI